MKTPNIYVPFYRTKLDLEGGWGQGELSALIIIHRGVNSCQNHTPTNI